MVYLDVNAPLAAVACLLAVMLFPLSRRCAAKATYGQRERRPEPLYPPDFLKDGAETGLGYGVF